MTYDDAVAYLNSLTNYEHVHDPKAMREVTLERMRELCRRLGDPQRRFRSILVSGTNGKGSICAMLYSMLRESSLRVGLYTSPHLEDLRERIRAWTPDGNARERAHADDWIRDADVAAIVERLQPALEQLRAEAPKSPPTYFEAVTAVALAYFAQRQVEIAVLEVGLGGRLDATNVVEQAISILSPIDLDHTDVLGMDLAAIAKEKAGIIKPSQTVISAPQHEVVAEVLRRACEAQGAWLVTCGRELTVSVQRHDLEGLEIFVTGLRGLYESLTIPLVGRHQATNAALAIGALEALSETGVPHAFIERGLARVVWPGRLEVVNQTPLVIMDGAHNPHAAAALAQTLGELCHDRRLHVLLGMSSDKSVEDVAKCLGSLAASVTCTKSRNLRAVDPAVLAQRLAPYCSEVHVMPEPADAYTYLLHTVAPEDVVVVTGSLFLVGELRAAIRRSPIGRMEQCLL